jgi:hypothetical protein
MDNDKKYIRLLKGFYRKAKFKWDYRNLDIMEAEAGNQQIAELIRRGDPAMVARCGAVEMRCVNEYLSGNGFSASIRQEIQRAAGVFPTEDGILKKFCEYYIACTSQADLLAIWGVGAESKIIRSGSKARLTQLTALEPYYFEQPWSGALKGKKVLVIHPFKDSIESQYRKRNYLFDHPEVLPELASLACVKAVQSAAGAETEYASWFDALASMCAEIDRADFEIAIIGAGAYSLPLAAYVKRIGKIAVQMSGATQILFGIMGKRWEQIPEVFRLWNEYWVRPSELETPKQYKLVEGGCYW